MRPSPATIEVPVARSASRAGTVALAASIAVLAFELPGIFRGFPIILENAHASPK